MKLQIGSLALVTLAQGAVAQSGPWERCGGIGHTGPTTCVAGYHCVEHNDWYFQCVPGDGPGTSTTSTTTTSTPPSSSTASDPPPEETSAPPSSCNATFEPISAEEFVAAMNPGWNLGNTLDSIPDEDSWNNNLVQEEVFDYVVEQGFKSVRIPVTWTHHFVSEAPDWTIDPDWLQRVSDVIDMALARDLYVITNVHHDSWEWADITDPGADIEAIQEKFRAVWYQIGVKLGCKSSLVSFESINEPPSDTAAHGALINEFNDIFYEAVTESGGFNTERVLNFVGGFMDPTKTADWFEPPSNVSNPWALQYHYYAPYDFIFSAWGKTIWGSDEDYAALRAELSQVRGNFTDVPLILGEYDASLLNTEPAARWKWFDHVARVATEHDTALVIWDNGLDHLDRNAGTWRDPVALAIIDAAIAGETSSMPDSTTDPGAEEQWSSAFIWNRVGDEVEDYELPWLFNGNTLVAVETQAGESLSEGDDYTASSDSITFTESFLSQYLGPDVETGSKANLTLTFSEGAFSVVEVIQWDTPEVPDVPSPIAGQDLNIPFEYAGWKMVAAVRVQAADGTILFDDWTQWLPTLQQGRATFNNHWFFDNEQIVIRAEAIAAVMRVDQPVEFEFEFYPRVDGNSITLTLDPAEF